MKPKPKSEVRNHRSEIVLFAVTGMSPAIITETVWALAHEKPAVIPDRVVVVTTTAGREALRRELFERPGASGKRKAGSGKEAANCVWEQLRAALAASRLPLAAKLRFGTTGDDIRVFTRADARGRSIELDDIRTPADSEAAADFLLNALRSFTENPEWHIVGSLAGGRKTMGALLYACFSLMGREADRLTHVLVNEPFDDPRLEPRFYFPPHPSQEFRLPVIGNRKSKIANSTSARIELADVPFVPLRHLFPRQLGRLPGNFMALVRQYRLSLDELSQPPSLQFDEAEKIVRVDGRPVSMPATALALLDFLARRCRRGDPAFAKYQEAVEPFQQFLAAWGRDFDPLNYRGDPSVKNLSRNCTDQDLRKLVNTVRTSLLTAGVPRTVAHHLLPHRGHFGIRIASA